MQNAFYVQNGHGDVVAVTDEDGTVLNSYEYDSYGNVTSANETHHNSLRYCGELQGIYGDLVYLRNRIYNPEIKRFMTEDPYWNVNNMIYGDEGNVDVVNTFGKVNKPNDVLPDSISARNIQKDSDLPKKLGISDDGYKIDESYEIKLPSADAIVQSGNLYVYCNNNPINYWDPSGQSTVGALIVATAPKWLPVVVGVTTTIVAGVTAYYAAEHKKLNGSKKKTNDKHTKPRPGRDSEKKKQSPTWERRK